MCQNLTYTYSIFKKNTLKNIKSISRGNDKSVEPTSSLKQFSI